MSRPEWPAREIESCGGICSRHAALWLRSDLCPTPAPDPERLRLTWNLLQPDGRVKAEYGHGIVSSPIPFSATAPTGSTHLACQLALYFPFELTVAEGRAPVMPVVSESLAERASGLGRHLSHLSHFLVIDSTCSHQQRLQFLAQVRQLGSGRACARIHSL